LARAAQQEHLRAVRPPAQLRFHAVAHRLPVALLRQLPAPLPDLATRRADQVAPAALLQPAQVVRAHHAAIHHPDALRQAEARLPPRPAARADPRARCAGTSPRRCTVRSMARTAARSPTPPPSPPTAPLRAPPAAVRRTTCPASAPATASSPATRPRTSGRA